MNSYRFLHSQYCRHVKRAKEVESLIMTQWHKLEARRLYQQMAEVADQYPLAVVMNHINNGHER